MRLTHLKLAGFKSFVDPTTLHIHGQRVGVVGPNGCGKSNVMESVRWVLGESSAKEMRADAMDAVIFNGSSNRKSISRASVELVFDNSLGGAAGEWSQYAEISVKRVIERDKGSTYYINNTVVRRRDVADLFLGTGLGGRAYAIIGQNTINRIVEAKPEELRIFLEEAAGISKYKERRRETESRLRDTRENLTRVEDILREMDKQVTRLQSQAVVAQQYHKLQAALNLAKSQVWLLKKRDASTVWQNAQHDVEKLVNELEAQVAHLRSNEADLESARQQNFVASEAVHVAQAGYYEINAEVSNLENQVKHTTEAKERLQLQLTQLNSQLEKNSLQNISLQNQLNTAQADIHSANIDFTQAEAAISAEKEAIPAISRQHQSALAIFNANQAALSCAEQKLRLEQSNLSHISRLKSDTEEQIKRLKQQYNNIQLTSNEAIASKESELAAIEVEVSSLEKMVSTALQNEQAGAIEIKKQRELCNEQQRALSVLEAELNSLTKIQQNMSSGNNQTALNNWLKAAGLNSNARFWQSVKIKKGWETALESILGAKLNAIKHHNLDIQSRPPSGLTIVNSVQAHVTNEAHDESRITSFFSLIEHVDVTLKATLQDWLAGAFILEDVTDVEVERQKLVAGEYLVSVQGDIYTQYSNTYFGEQSLLHGVLERQAQLDHLNQQRPIAQNRNVAMQETMTQLEQHLQTLRAEQQTKNLLLKSTTQQQHQLSLALQQLKQAQQNASQRQQLLQIDITNAEQKSQSLANEIESKQLLINQISKELSDFQSKRKFLDAEKQKTESALHVARNQLQNMERALQENNYLLKLKNNNINELVNKIKAINEELTHLKLRVEETEATLAVTKMEGLRANLETALNTKQEREKALALARDHLSVSEQTLQQLERSRMQNEQLLHPMRDQLELCRLNEQQARLHFEQCQSELDAANMSESELNAELSQYEKQANRAVKVTDIERKRNKLGQEIEALGPVNLAAIQELETELARKTYLDSQCKDLADASQTLEDAIRKIDKETRGRLQATFDEANRHFSELFSTLFGGGLARLELLGEEILDTGMQVFAQPPGKKNSTIHLLSGGEKALTALALVFALFRLNPAPFCLMDEVDAPLDDSNTERFCAMVKKMSEKTQFLYVSHNKITMEMAQQLIGVTMQESGVSRIVDVDMEDAIKLAEEAIA